VIGPKTHEILGNGSDGLPGFDLYGRWLYNRAALRPLYRNPYREISNLGFDGYDQGVDFYGSGTVYPVGPAVVHVATLSSGWPGGGAVAYKLSQGKASGLTIYFAENIQPLVGVGQTVYPGTPLATMKNVYPFTESGWAQDETDNPMSQPISHLPTHFGVNYGDLLRSLGERRCPPGVPVTGTPLPPDWPSW
jgi:hypothetical protein